MFQHQRGVLRSVGGHIDGHVGRRQDARGQQGVFPSHADHHRIFFLLANEAITKLTSPRYIYRNTDTRNFFFSFVFLIQQPRRLRSSSVLSNRVAATVDGSRLTDGDACDTVMKQLGKHHGIYRRLRGRRVDIGGRPCFSRGGRRIEGGAALCAVVALQQERKTPSRRQVLKAPRRYSFPHFFFSFSFFLSSPLHSASTYRLYPPHAHSPDPTAAT